MSGYQLYESAASDQVNNFDGWYSHQILAQSPPGHHDEQQHHHHHQEEEAIVDEPSSPPVLLPPLPPGWQEMRDMQTGRMYYLNNGRQITTWDHPVLDVTNVNDLASADGEDVGDDNNIMQDVPEENDAGRGSTDHTATHDMINIDTAVQEELGKEKDDSREDDQKLSPPSSSSTTRKTSEKWEKNMEELRAYKKKHGHVNVRQKSGQLGRWVNNARQFYNRKAKGENNALTDDRIKDLDELGFEWKLKRGIPPTFALLAQKTKSNTTKKPKKKSHPSNRNSNISTKMLSDGTQVIESEEKLKHADGSTIESTTEESINKRTVQLDSGARILETTTKIVMTKVERIVLPALLPEAICNTDNGEQKQSTEESDAKMPALPANESVAVSIKDR